MPRLRVTVNFTEEYDADPADYGTDNPQEMAKIDADNYKADPWLSIDPDSPDFKIEVTVVED